MGLFSNVFFDMVIIVVALIMFSQIIVPLWRNAPWFPSFRKLKKNIRKTQENVR